MGPLSGIRVIEMAGMGPGPFCAMLLSDLGAEVLRIDRAQSVRDSPGDEPGKVLNRGRLSVGFDLKNPDAKEALLDMIDQADALIEGFRPGVMERLGFGPDVCRERNPGLVYGRMTGFGQDGPLAQTVGHDINYIALTGALHAIGPKGGKPVPPLNLVGDFGGGGLMLAFGIVSALVERATSGKGQVIDAAMVDGAATLMNIIYGLMSMGGAAWSDERGSNLLDGAAPFYDTYETSDGKYISVGSIEPPFYAQLLETTGLSGEDLPEQMDQAQWDQTTERFTEIFKQKTRDEWCKIMAEAEVCFAPVLSIGEAPHYPHNVARSTFVEIDGVKQAAPAPRFSRTPGEIQGAPAAPGRDTSTALEAWGFSPEDVLRLRKAGAIK